MSSEIQTLVGADDDAPAAASSSFYAAMRILPAPQRDAMYYVYAFCRAVDDVADGGGPRDRRLSELQAYKTDIAQLYAGGRATSRTRYLAAPVADYDLREADFIAVIDGMEMDVLRDIQAPDWEEFDLYCDRAASAVGRLSVRIFGMDEAMGIELSHHLGRALQFTNILRDLDEDAAIGRLYLPRQALDDAGITGGDINEILANPALDRACRGLALKARKHYNTAEAIMANCPRRAARSPRMMATVYRGILEKLIARGWRAPRSDVRRSKRYVLWAVLRDGIF